MSLNSQALAPHLQKMIFEMELRGYAQHTKNHYLCHVKLLEKHTGKSALEITPDELKQYLHDRIKSGIGFSSGGFMKLCIVNAGIVDKSYL